MTTYRDLPFDEHHALTTPHDPASCRRDPCGRCKPQSPPRAPQVGVNPHDADPAPAPPDKTVRSIGLAKHGSPHEIAKRLRELARVLDENGMDAIDGVSTLADRAYPHATLGDGGSRGTDDSSVQERTVSGTPDRWAGADSTYARNLAVIEKLAVDLKARTHDILHHAQLVDPTPTGTGECKGCARVCRPDGDRPGNRLRSGLCPTCYRAWLRYRGNGGLLIRSAWATQRRESMTERGAKGELIAVHTPEPDHDIDLTTEEWADDVVTEPETIPDQGSTT